MAVLLVRKILLTADPGAIGVCSMGSDYFGVAESWDRNSVEQELMSLS
jgi:hypothetical protein